MGSKLADVKKILFKELPYLKKEYGVDRIGIFGSLSRGQETEKSDVDFVVEFSKPIGLKFVDLTEYLEKLIGKKVDILTPEGINSIRIGEIAENIKRSVLYV